MHTHLSGSIRQGHWCHYHANTSHVKHSLSCFESTWHDWFLCDMTHMDKTWQTFSYVILIPAPLTHMSHVTYESVMSHMHLTVNVYHDLFSVIMTLYMKWTSNMTYFCVIMTLHMSHVTYESVMSHTHTTWQCMSTVTCSSVIMTIHMNQSCHIWTRHDRVHGGEDAYDASSCRSFSAKEPLITLGSFTENDL